MRTDMNKITSGFYVDENGKICPVADLANKGLGAKLVEHDTWDEVCILKPDVGEADEVVGQYVLHKTELAAKMAIAGFKYVKYSDGKGFLDKKVPLSVVMTKEAIIYNLSAWGVEYDQTNEPLVLVELSPAHVNNSIKKDPVDTLQIVFPDCIHGEHEMDILPQSERGLEILRACGVENA